MEAAGEEEEKGTPPFVARAISLVITQTVAKHLGAINVKLWDITQMSAKTKANSNSKATNNSKVTSNSKGSKDATPDSIMLHRDHQIIIIRGLRGMPTSINSKQ